MKKLFENKTTYTKETYIEFLKFHNKTYNFSYMLYTIFWSTLLILCIYLSFGTQNRLQGVILTIALVCFIFYRIYRPQFIVNKELKSDKIDDNNTNTFSFFDKNFEVKNNNGSFTFKYFGLHRVFETACFFYLYVNRENAFLVSKNAFSIGTAEEFSKFIKEKCKLKYRLKKS